MAYISNAEKFGMEKGIEEGIEEGMQEGWLEGKREGKLEIKLEIAKNLLEQGIKPAIVIKATGFSSAKIKKLQQELKRDKIKLEILKQAALKLDKLLFSSGVTEEELFQEYRALRKNKTNKK